MELLLVVVGALAGLGGSVVVETFRSRREHDRWLLDRRYDVYVDALGHVGELLTWARNEATGPLDTPPPERKDFHELTARMALVGSKAVQKAWGELDAPFRQFPMTHVAAIGARQAAEREGHADTADAIRLRAMLDEIVTRARAAETALAKAMESDLNK